MNVLSLLITIISTYVLGFGALYVTGTDLNFWGCLAAASVFGLVGALFAILQSHRAGKN